MVLLPIIRRVQYSYINLLFSVMDKVMDVNIVNGARDTNYLLKSQESDTSQLGWLKSKKLLF